MRRTPDSSLLVPLCHDHFSRVANKTVCDHCPSKLENESSVRVLAEAFERDQAGANETLIIEIQSIRRTQNEMLKVMDQIPSMREEMLKLRVTLSGVDGDNGLRGHMKEARDQLSAIQRRCDDMQRYIWLGIGGTMVASFVIPFFFKR